MQPQNLKGRLILFLVHMIAIDEIFHLNHYFQLSGNKSLLHIYSCTNVLKVSSSLYLEISEVSSTRTHHIIVISNDNKSLFCHLWFVHQHKPLFCYLQSSLLFFRTTPPLTLVIFYVGSNTNLLFDTTLPSTCRQTSTSQAAS